MAYSNIPVGVLFAMQESYTPFEMELFTGIQENPPASELITLYNKCIKKRDIQAINILNEQYDIDIIFEGSDAEQDLPDVTPEYVTAVFTDVLQTIVKVVPDYTYRPSKKAIRREALHSQYNSRKEEAANRMQAITKFAGLLCVIRNIEAAKLHNDPHYGKYLHPADDGKYVFSAKEFLIDQSYSLLKRTFILNRAKHNNEMGHFRSTKNWPAYSFVVGIMGLSEYQDIVINILESKKRHPAPKELMAGIYSGTISIK